jgi:hypothetical protein
VQPGGIQPGDIGKPVKLGDAQAATADDIVLVRACAIAGRVVDEFGDPVSNVLVRVLRSQSIGGVRRMVMTSGASTNDLGQYRAFGLQPGSYFVSADGPRGVDGEIGDRTGYAPTYYPGTPNVSEAQPVQLSAGQDMPSVDIMLALVRTARISGIALDSGGRPAVNALISPTLMQSGMAGAMGGTGTYARVLEDGTFTLNGVPPGDYVLAMTLSQGVASSSGGPTAPRMEYGRARVSVGGSDVTGVAIQSNAGATISGLVMFDGASSPPKAKLTIMASTPPSLDSGPMNTPTGPPAQVAADGTFTLTGVFGDRVFRVTGQPSGWVLKAVYANGRDMIDTPLALEGREQIAGVQIVMTDRVTHVTAAITDDRGEPADFGYVLVVPDDPAKLGPGSRFQRAMVVTPGVPAKIDNLPPGDYVGVVFKSVPQGLDAYEPDFLERVRKIGVKFSLREGETRALTLKVIDQPAK